MLGPHSSDKYLARAKENTRKGRLLKQFREELTEHLGGNLTPPQRALVERAAMLQVRCTLFDERILNGTFTSYDSKVYLAFTNSLGRTLTALGLTKNQPRKNTRENRLMRQHRTLTDILAEAAE